MLNDNTGRDYCRVCGKMLEEGVICKVCSEKYKPKDNIKINNYKEV